MFKHILLILLFILTACAPAPTNTPNPLSSASETPQVIKIYATQVTHSWLMDAYTCAEQLHILLYAENDPQAADIKIQLGEPEQLTSPAFQIGQDDIVVVANRESALQNMSEAEIRQLFSNPTAEQGQVWVFSTGQDSQQVFNKAVMKGQAITSLARVALSPQQMSDVLNQDKNAVGILPRLWKAGAVRDIYTITGIPILAIIKTEPQGQIQSILGCLQKK